MSKAKKQYPHQQPFNVAPRRCQSKNKKTNVSWWSKPPFHNNGSKKD